MRYFFILGRIPELSAKEIFSCLEREQISYSNVQILSDALLLTASREIPLHSFVDRLGGCVKAGRVVETLPFLRSAARLASELVPIIRRHKRVPRLSFGISVSTLPQDKKITKGRALPLRDLGMEIKRALKEEGCVARWIPVQEDTSLSSVSVDKHGLLKESGIELCLFFLHDSIEVGITQAVQAYELFSYRDWQRPQKNMRVGLLPPKLARIMVNLSCSSFSPNPHLLDPFCGYGTIIQEALLLGVPTLTASDLSSQAIKATQTNITWLAKSTSLPSRNVSYIASDVRTLASRLSSSIIDVIVTEPTLGPPLSKKSVPQKSLITDLCKLYVQTFKTFYKLLKKNGRVVIVFPIWLTKQKNFFIPCIQDIIVLGFSNVTLSHIPFPCTRNTTPRNSFLITRPDSRVGRELFVFDLDKK